MIPLSPLFINLTFPASLLPISEYILHYSNCKGLGKWPMRIGALKLVGLAIVVYTMLFVQSPDNYSPFASAVVSIGIFSGILLTLVAAFNAKAC